MNDVSDLIEVNDFPEKNSFNAGVRIVAPSEGVERQFAMNY